MSDNLPLPRSMSRIVCIAHRMFARAVTETLSGLDVRPTLLEPARCVRQRIQSRRWGLPGQTVKLENTPMDVYWASVPPAAAAGVMQALSEAAKLRVPGHGALFSQDIIEYTRLPPQSAITKTDTPAFMTKGMALLTCILSQEGSGQDWAAAALSFGAGVPIISRGEGVGIRDRLGLIRIAVPREKEMVRLIVPAQDAGTLRNLMIEETHMDRPGGGFLYQTPIQASLTDPLLRLGHQRHAASMEQVIAAIDEIKDGTTWRKRIVGRTHSFHHSLDSQQKHYREIVFICPEEAVEAWSNLVIEAGVRGVTACRARCLSPKPGEGGGGTREMGTALVETHQADKVVHALRHAISRTSDPGIRLQVLEAPTVFTHQSRS